MRQTSLDAYNKIKTNGLLSQRRFDVYEIIFVHGPLTGAAVADKFYADRKQITRSENVRNRITELRDMGVVKEVGFQTDTATGMRVILWDVTDNLPVKLRKKITVKNMLLRLQRKSLAMIKAFDEWNSDTSSIHRTASFVEMRTARNGLNDELESGCNQ